MEAASRRRERVSSVPGRVAGAAHLAHRGEQLGAREDLLLEQQPRHGAAIDEAAFLIMYLGECTMRLAISVDRAEGDRIVEAYKKTIEATVAPIRDKLAAIPEDKRWLVSSEGAFSYLARDFELKELYLWPINADQQGTPKQVRKVIDTVRENKIPAIFSESTVSDKPARQVARETGAHYGGVLYVDSLSDARGAVPTYLKLLEVTVDTIAKGFGQ